jgi:hypothetical protein
MICQGRAVAAAVTESGVAVAKAREQFGTSRGPGAFVFGSCYLKEMLKTQLTEKNSSLL